MNEKNKDFEINKRVAITIEWLRKSIDFRYQTCNFIEYSSFFEFLLKYASKNNTKLHYEKSDTNKNIADQICTLNDFCVLENPFNRHDVISGEMTLTQGPLIIVFYSNTPYNVDQKIENSLFQFVDDKKLYKAELIVHETKNCQIDNPIFFPSSITISTDLSLLSHESFFPLRAQFSSSINNPPKITKLLLPKSKNVLIIPEYETLLRTNTLSTRLSAHNTHSNYLSVFYEVALNNTIVIHGDRTSSGYLKESYDRGTLWYDLSNENVLHNELKNASYNGR